MSRDDNDNLPKPYEPGPPSRPTPRAPAQPTPRAPARPTPRAPARPTTSPVHAAGVLDFVYGQDRDYWWGLLDSAVKRRIAQKTGERIEWWAHHHSTEKERPYAVVLGTHGLAVTTPTTNNAGRPAHLVRSWSFDPATMGYSVVRQEPYGWPGAGQAGLGQVSPGQAGAADAGPQLPLTTRVRGFLGNLPAEAQGRLQEPFLDGDHLLKSDFYYYGSEEHLNVWCYLAWTRAVTFAAGERVAAAGAPPQAAAWNLVCRKATVVRR